MTKRLVVALVCVLALSTILCKAQDSGGTQPRLVDCASVGSGTGARPSQMSSLDQEFGRAVCEFSRQTKGSSEMQATVAELVALQTRGLRPEQQSFAGLMETLLHCRMGQSALDQMKTDKARGSRSSDGTTRMLCSSRRQAAAALSDVDWSTLGVLYVPGTCQSGTGNGNDCAADSLLAELRECTVDGPMAAAQDDVCGIYRPVDSTQRKNIIADEVIKTANQYIGSGSSHITGMFQRKQALTAIIVDKAKASLPGLQADSARIGSVTDTMNDAYRTQIEPIVAQLMDPYHKAYVTGKSIVDLIDRWQGGLLIDKKSNNHNMSDDLAAQLKQFDSDLDRLANTMKPPTSQIVHIETGLKILFGHEEQVKVNVRTLCVHFYCELGAAQFGSWSAFRLACESPGLAGKNPLCGVDNPVVAVTAPQHESTTSLRDLCVQAGFHEEYAHQGLTSEQVRACRGY